MCLGQVGFGNVVKTLINIYQILALTDFCLICKGETFMAIDPAA